MLGNHDSNHAADVHLALSARAAERTTMVRSQIEARGIRDHRVLDAMRSVPRELFLDNPTRRDAYDDRALPIGFNQSISQPYIVAYMTDRLDLKGHHRVLEVGTGSGYQTAILARLVRHVVSVERLAALSEQAGRRLRWLGTENVTLIVGDGSLGVAEQAPFDRILVTAGAPTVPSALIDQLTDEGILVMPVGGSSEQTVVRLRRAATRTIREDLLPCRFVKLIGNQGWTEPDAH